MDTQKFGLLFRGRTDSYFLDLGDDRHTSVSEPLSIEVLRRHLTGAGCIGVYPVDDDKHCWWGCADIDDGDYNKAVRFAGLAEQAGLTCWIESSRSKGYHCWIFAYEPVRSIDMMAAMAFIDRMAETEIAELNPKGEGGDGLRVNCVRLPYFGGADPGRQVVLDSDENPIALGAFVEEALDLRVSADGLAGLADKQRLHLSSARLVSTETSASRGLRPRTPRSDTKAARAYRRERRVESGERDETAFALANYMKNGLGLTKLAALEAMQEIYYEMFDDPATFPVDDALKKVERVYE